VQGQEKTAAHGVGTEPWCDTVLLEADLPRLEVVENPTSNRGHPKQIRNSKAEMTETKSR